MKSSNVSNKVCNFDLYRPVWAVHTCPSGYRYADRLLPGGSAKNRPSTVDFDRRRPIEEEIDRRQSIEREIDRRRLIEEEKGKKKRKRRKKKRRIPRLRRGSLFLPREETECLPLRGERSRRHRYILVSTNVPTHDSSVCTGVSARKTKEEKRKVQWRKEEGRRKEEEE
ncbi:hypothetical protein BHE74_00003401 [Ensete ventricosum]|nr:hypothetical protein BHE74_00003401 [Ensete ventricosum]